MFWATSLPTLGVQVRPKPPEQEQGRLRDQTFAAFWGLKACKDCWVRGFGGSFFLGGYKGYLEAHGT